jgi:hypothetical protein
MEIPKERLFAGNELFDEEKVGAAAIRRFAAQHYPGGA